MSHPAAVFLDQVLHALSKDEQVLELSMERNPSAMVPGGADFIANAKWTVTTRGPIAAGAVGKGAPANKSRARKTWRVIPGGQGSPPRFEPERIEEIEETQI